ncbi:serine/threonine protein kinase [Nostocaceae cyanobacterium CENA369]|uniref:Serine/threonine protein kinase n=1 Tax=Dendronalium phyllosphericum CENA369 TaxID=1725256 RepID=A0A8J7LFW4_9NOST|nr:serine/threonine-protein kinase [Dendronalium phyllosphericum]MBH8572394.1 serine/threonine protein kinase [Dendronalium phyllosphericum CENA369]
MTLSEGDNLKSGKYTILEKLPKEEGEGGYGVVYKARDNYLNDRDNSLNDIVAIKSLKKEEVTPQKYKDNLERFKREKDTLKKLQSPGHPNIVKYYEYFEENEIHYLVIEFLDGNNLSKLLEEKGKLKYQLAFDYIYQIGLGLKYVHGKNLVHRDVHPKNIMIVKTKVKNKQKTRAVLIDFGNVKYRELITSLHISIPHYTHHKQRDGDFDPKFDVYSLAACLYYTLTNEDPTRSEERERRRSRKETDLPPIKTHNKKIKKNVQKAVYKGMPLEPEKIPSMKDWLNLLPKPLPWRWQQLTKVAQATVKNLNRFLRHML